MLKAADITTAGNLNAVTDFGPSGGSYAFTDTTNTYLVVNAPTATQPTGDGNFDNGEIIIEIVGTPDGTIKCYLRGWRLCRCLTPTPPSTPNPNVPRSPTLTSARFIFLPPPSPLHAPAIFLASSPQTKQHNLCLPLASTPRVREVSSLCSSPKERHPK